MVRSQSLAKSKTNRQQQSTRALIHKYLAWLPGAPVRSESPTLRWLHFTKTERIGILEKSIGCQELSQARFAIKKLSQEQPKQLKHWLPDPEDWLVRVDHLLDCLSQSKTDPPVDFSPFFGQRWQLRFQQLSRQTPSLNTLLRTLAFFQLTDPYPPSGALFHWIEVNQAALTDLDSAEEIQGFAISDQLKFQIKFCMIS